MPLFRLSQQQFLKLKFIGCLLLISGILVSKAILSLTTVYLVLIVILSGEYRKWNTRLFKSKALIPFVLYFLWTCFSLVWSRHVGDGVQMLIANLNFYLIPFLLALTSPMTKIQNRYLLYFFAGFVILISFVNFIVFQYNKSAVDIRNLSLFISHIRYSLCIVIASVIVVYFAFKVKRNSLRFLLYSLALWLIFYTFYSQVLSGVLGYIGVIIALIGIKFYKSNSHRMQWLLLFLLTSLGVLITLIILSMFRSDGVKISRKSLPKYTKEGNVYTHDVQSSESENGYPLNCYLSIEEMDSAWYTRSKVSLDDLNAQGFSSRTVLIRYLTSKGLRKDAEGVLKLSEKDINNVEMGVPSILQLKHGMVARYYDLKYELSQHDNPNGHSMLQRFEYWKAAFYLVKKNIVIGVGIGDYERAYQNAYKVLKSPLLMENRLGSHNQFLFVWVNFGIVGFFLFNWILFAAGLTFLRDEKYLAFILLIVLICSFLVEDTLGTLTGMSLFSFFYGLNMQNNVTIVDN